MQQKNTQLVNRLQLCMQRALLGAIAHSPLIETDKFVRQVDVGKPIGIDQSGKNTSVIIITDKKGNLINRFPGAL